MDTVTVPLEGRAERIDIALDLRNPLFFGTQHIALLLDDLVDVLVLAADLFEEILALSPDQGLNTVVKRNLARVVEVIVEDEGVLRDIDTPEQFARLLGENQ